VGYCCQQRGRERDYQPFQIARDPGVLNHKINLAVSRRKTLLQPNSSIQQAILPPVIHP
jgi:hypothetical protein